MKKVFWTFAAAFMIAGCSAAIDKEVTLTKYESTMEEVREKLGSPDKVAAAGKNKYVYEYNTSNTVRDVTTELVTGWKLLDNHVLTLCNKGKKKCQVFKAKKNESAKGLKVFFVNGVMVDAVLKDPGDF